MSAIAKVLLHNGTRVSGSDTGSGEIIDELKNMGATIYGSHDASNISGQNLVVYTAAVKDDNPELVEARKRDIETVDRATMLGWIMKDYKNAISVAGTHGKTTTTSMMTYILTEAMLDPTVMVGGELDILGGNFKMGRSDYFITESCEYCRSFLKFFPKIAIILNVEEDHLDYYRDIDDIIDAFSDFAGLVPPDGYVIIPSEDKNAVKAAENAKGKVITFGWNSGDFRPVNIEFNRYGYAEFDVCMGDKKMASIKLNVAGKHNVLNATACIAAAYAMGIDMSRAESGLNKFTGTKRRFEKKGYCNGALVIDDYAHHPTEIKTTIDSVSRLDHNKAWFIFQPHTYTRTYTLFDEFVNVLSKAENLIIADIYAAREKDTGLVSSKKLADAIDGAVYLDSFEKIEGYIRQNASEGDVILTVGAGNVVKIGENLIK
ncbi:MAG: UDP-N-acetylmuramate--L-alanine ligase [Clostridia bacterium]|nr:UDP-N-acetylmuramate--L-alanine ligase [Clostridia bacterium]